MPIHLNEPISNLSSSCLKKRAARNEADRLWGF